MCFRTQAANLQMRSIKGVATGTALELTALGLIRTKGSNQYREHDYRDTSQALWVRSYGESRFQLKRF